MKWPVGMRVRHRVGFVGIIVDLEVPKGVNYPSVMVQRLGEGLVSTRSEYWYEENISPIDELEFLRILAEEVE